MPAGSAKRSGFCGGRAASGKETYTDLVSEVRQGVLELIERRHAGAVRGAPEQEQGEAGEDGEHAPDRQGGRDVAGGSTLTGEFENLLIGQDAEQAERRSGELDANVYIRSLVTST